MFAVVLVLWPGWAAERQRLVVVLQAMSVSFVSSLVVAAAVAKIAAMAPWSEWVVEVVSMALQPTWVALEALLRARRAVVRQPHLRAASAATAVAAVARVAEAASTVRWALGFLVEGRSLSASATAAVMAARVGLATSPRQASRGRARGLFL